MNKIIAVILNSFIISLAMCGQLYAQTASLLPNALQQYFDSNGNPVTSGTVDFYIPSTSTRKTTWSDSAETTPNTNPVILDAAGRPNGGLQIFGSGSYRQVLKDMNGNTIWDKVTSSTLAPGQASLVGDGAAVGSIKPWAGIVAPLQYAFAYGQEVSRTTYANLFTAITLTNTVACTSSSTTISSIPDTTQIPIGANIELSCMPAGTTVVSKTASTVVASNPSNITSNVTAIFFPFGNGNGTTTFNVPDLRGRVIAGRTNMGGTNSTILSSCTSPDSIGGKCGTQSQTIAQANLPVITLATAIAAGQGSHTHTYSAPAGNSGASGGAVQVNSGVTNTGASTLPSMTGTTPLGGSGTALNILQPMESMNYVIKVLTDASISTSTVVTSIQGMVGDLTCGANMTCGAGVISSTGGGAGTTPGGNTTDIQFNSSGAFAGSPNLTWSNPTLTIGATGSSGALTIVGSVSGNVTQTAQGTAGNTIITWGNSTGTPAVTASAPLAITTTTGNIACVTCATSANNLSFFAATTSAQLLSIISDETGSGSLVFNTSPTLATPSLGIATATSINGLTLTSSTGTFTLTNAKTFSVANSIALAGVDSSTITFQGTDTYVGRATTDTLTNKTFDTGGTGNVFKIGGASVTAIAGNTATVGTTSGVLTSGHCVSIDANANLVDAGGACTTGGGGGTVSGGTAGQIAYYGTSSTIVSGNPNLTIATGALTVGLAGGVQGTVKISGATSGTTTLAVAAAASGILTLPSATDTIVGRATADTLTNKTLTAPIIATISNTGTLTLPTSTDTLIGKATTDTLTNKTYNTAGTGNAFSINGQSITAVSGNTSKVATTSGTLTNNNCVSIDASGNLIASGGACGAVASISNSDGTLTISPTTGASVASINLAHANTWTAIQKFNANTYFGSGAPWVDVKSGANSCAAAVGNASTDDSAAIQCQINYMNSTYTGGIVYFPPGNYIIGTTLTVKGTVILLGSGIGVSSITVTGGTLDITALAFDSTTVNAGIRDLFIVGDIHSTATNPTVTIASGRLVNLTNSYIWGGSYALQTAGVDGFISDVYFAGFGTAGGGINSTGANWYERVKIDQAAATTYGFHQGACAISLCENHFGVSDFSGTYTYSLYVDDTTNTTAITTIHGGVFSSPIVITKAKATIINGSEIGSTTLTNNATGPLIVGASYGFAATTANGTGPRSCAANYNITC